MTNFDAIVKAYDIRGLVPDELDADGARRIGRAFASFAGAPDVLVARDMRPSGVELSRAFAEGVMDVGANVTDLGLTSTDLLYFASGRLDRPGAMFTASHNPAQYNGVKMCLAGAAPISLDTGLAKIRDDAKNNSVDIAEKRGSRRDRSMLSDFAEHVLSFADLDDARPLRIVADTANGMGGLVVPEVFARLPFELDILYPELDGTFPNHPADPIQPENVRDLQRRVLETGADVGLAFDGDADRVFLVDEKGQIISGSLTSAIVAQAMLRRHPGATILYNVICSRTVREVIEENGGSAVRTPVGHSLIKKIMAETGAVFGAEHSGHYYFRENYRADSGLISAVIVLSIMARSENSLSELIAPFRRYAASGEVNTRVDDPTAAIEHVAEKYPDGVQDRLDGLTVDYEDWWFNLRPSNTEPLLRLNVEAADEATCKRMTDEIRALFTP